MGGQLSCCSAPNSPRQTRRRRKGSKSSQRRSSLGGSNAQAVSCKCSVSLQHISERELCDDDVDPSTDPTKGSIFMQRSKSDMKNGKDRKSEHYIQQQQLAMVSGGRLKKSNSCSTIYLDDSTLSQPNLKHTLKCVTLAIYFHIHKRSNDRVIDIFDETIFPLTKDDMSCLVEPDHRMIYRFVRTLFNAALLSAECAIVTLVYLERLLTYAETDMVACTWRRMLLGAILLASKVWDDQAVWNVDYCQILKETRVEDMNALERSFLELIDFNINVPSSVYAKYYFELRSLAEQNGLSFPPEPLSRSRALRLEAMSRLREDKVLELLEKKWSSLEHLSQPKRSTVILS